MKISTQMQRLEAHRTRNPRGPATQQRAARQPLSMKLAAIVLVWLCGWQGAALAVIEIEITQGGDNAIPIAIVPFGWEGAGEPPADVAQIVSDDLQRSGSFSPLNREDLVASPVSGDAPRYGNWRLSGADFLVIGSLFERTGGITIEFQLFDVVQQELLTGFSFNVQGRNMRGAAHQIADEIHEEILGIKGAFNTQIAYIAVEGEGRQRTYQLELADADGFNPQTMLTSPRPIMSPAWAPDGNRIAYVSFENRENSAIYVQDRQQGSRSKLISRAGINGAPAWSPDGTRLAVTLSFEGNPEIYVVDVDSGQLSRITNSRSIDTEADWIDDDTLVFTSDRSGGPQLYEVSASGGRAERITFEGGYNASATASSDGRSIAFVHGTSEGYRIAAIDRQSGLFQVLTEGTLDESPSFAPNGQMVLFATERGGRGTLGAVSIDGNVVQSLTLDSGAVREPAWSPFTR